MDGKELNQLNTIHFSNSLDDDDEDGIIPYFKRRRSSIDEYELFKTILPKSEFDLNGF
jgi:hypothetical protein